MGPTNVALVRLFLADQQLRQAQARLEAATKNVRVQQRRVADLTERLKLTQQQFKEIQAKASALETELKSRDAHIERLRQQQQQARNNKEYQSFLIEINTHKVDRGKIEDQTMAMLEQAEKLAGEVQALQTQLDTEQQKLATMQSEIGEKVASLQAEVESLKTPRDQAAAAVPPRALIEFDRMAERFDGEAMSAIAKPNPRREEYVCTACNMELVTDIYNRLHSRDEIIHCPSCRRLLFIPQELTPELAVNRKKPPREKNASGASSPTRARKSPWSETQFMNKVSQLDRPRLTQVHTTLLERLRSGGIDNVEVIFDVRNSTIPAYHVYIRGISLPLLCVQADGRYLVVWNADPHSAPADLLHFTRGAFDRFVGSGPDQYGWSQEDKALTDIDPDSLASAVFDVATRAAQAGVGAVA